MTDALRAVRSVIALDSDTDKFNESFQELCATRLPRDLAAALRTLWQRERELVLDNSVNFGMVLADGARAEGADTAQELWNHDVAEDSAEFSAYPLARCCDASYAVREIIAWYGSMTPERRTRSAGFLDRPLCALAAEPRWQLARWLLSSVLPFAVGTAACNALSPCADSLTLDLIEEWAPKSIIIGEYSDAAMLAKPVLLEATTWDAWGVLAARSCITSRRLALWMTDRGAMAKVAFCALEALLRLRENHYNGSRVDRRVLFGDPADLPVSTFLESNRQLLDEEFGEERCRRLGAEMATPSCIPHII